MEEAYRNQLMKELQILEDLSTIDITRSMIVFFGVGTDPTMYESKSKNEYLNKLFPHPMPQREIVRICKEKNLGRPFFIAMVDGSKLPTVQTK